ncbi:MAG TPA: DUF2933 domain-containing protein [Alphaproteobacteria bacterium]|nr:DUF2933 domain-containing protein [Alphaproteobacteria bacterium]
MSDHNNSDPQRQTFGSIWKSRSGAVLIAFLAIAGLLLAYEHRLHIFTGNGLLVALLALCVVMHLFMHSGHGRHGRNGDRHGSDHRGRP